MYHYESYLSYIHISWHKYARLRTIFDFMTKLKIQKIQIQFLEDREVIWPLTKKPTPDIILKKKLKIIFSHHQVALESWNYNHSTQNQKLTHSVVTVWYRKKPPLTVCFHSTNIADFEISSVVLNQWNRKSRLRISQNSSCSNLENKL